MFIYVNRVKKKETPVPKGYKEHYAFEDSSDDSQDNTKVRLFTINIETSDLP